MPSLSSQTPSARPLFAGLAILLASGLLSVATAQTPADDPYGIGAPSTESAPPPAPDTTRPPTARTDTGGAFAPPAPVAAPTAPDTAPDTAARAPRTRITRETTVNPMDMQRGKYRNPKKALFMSLIVPGLGQAYIGQSTFTYARAAAYFTADVTMGILWYQYSVVKYDRKVKQYQNLADEHWTQQAYEDGIGGQIAPDDVTARLNTGRDGYCSAVQRNEGSGAPLYEGCRAVFSEELDDPQKYFAFQQTYANDTSAAARAARRATFPNEVSFYAMIGTQQEFIFGWDDAVDAGWSFGADTAVTGTSANRDRYNSLRDKAQEYSRMQSWFLGGIVLNHIASAIDAALTARRHNRILYEGAEARWYDKVNVDGGMAFDQGRPRTHLMAYLSF
jgi:hypothetical protein